MAMENGKYNIALQIMHTSYDDPKASNLLRSSYEMGRNLLHLLPLSSENNPREDNSSFLEVNAHMFLKNFVSGKNLKMIKMAEEIDTKVNETLTLHSLLIISLSSECTINNFPFVYQEAFILFYYFSSLVSTRTLHTYELATE